MMDGFMPITREDTWLSAIINGTECNLIPITRKERYYAAILGNGTDMTPVTREETYLYAIANGQSTSLDPITRIERYLYAVANGDECNLVPITRLEKLLSAWTQSKPFTIVDKTPYILRQTASGASVGNKKKMKIVGGTVAFNQLVDSGTEAVTTISGRKYLARISGVDSVITGDGTDIAVTGGTDNVFDLSHLFGSIVAAWMTVEKFRALFPDGYYGYNVGELMSVKTSEHITTVSYPLDSIELLGAPRLDAGYNLFYDGDTYESDGTVTRWYTMVDLGSLSWSYSSNYGYFYSESISDEDRRLFLVCDAFMYGGSRSNGTGMTNAPERVLYQRSSSSGYKKQIMIKDTNYTTASAFRAAVTGVKMVYNIDTPTTETANPFAATMAVDPNGTEQFVDSRTVKIPVGQDTLYQEGNSGRSAKSLFVPPKEEKFEEKTDEIEKEDER